MTENIDKTVKMTLLSQWQVRGDNSLEVIRAQKGAPISDFAVGTGNFWGQSFEGHQGHGRTLLKTRYQDSGDYVILIGENNLNSIYEEKNSAAIRPIIEGKEAEELFAKSPKKQITINNHIFEMIEYGEYPQNVEWNYGEMESLYRQGKLKSTGKKYTFNQSDDDDEFSSRLGDSPVFKYKGKHYVRGIVRVAWHESTTINGCCAQAGHPCWYEVQPIEWIRDPSGVLVARQGLVSGIRAKDAEAFLNSHMADEMRVVSHEKTQQEIKEDIADWMAQHPNPDVKDFLEPMTDTDDNVITALVRSGLDTLDQVFPMDKWATMEAIPELKKIFAAVPRDGALMETMKKFDSKLRTTYNLNQRREERKKQHSISVKKLQGNQGGR